MLTTEKRIELLKTLAHPARIRILEELVEGVKCVSDFEETLDISQPNVSQHLKILKDAGLIRDFFPLTPASIIRHLNLLRPIYRETARNGHFGRTGPGFTWEKTDLAAKLRKAAAKWMK